MPFYEENVSEDTGPRPPQLREPQPRPDGSIWSAASRHQITIVSAYNYLAERSGYAYDPTHNPLDIIKDTPYEANYLDRFVESRSSGETFAIMRRIDRER